MRRKPFVVALVAVVAACALEGCGGPGRPGSDATSAPTVQGAAPAVVLTEIASANKPVVLATEPRTRVLYVGERAGTIRPLRDGQLGDPVLDLRARTSAEGERGLLGMTFAPTGAWLYVHYTDTEGDTRVDAFPFADGRANPAARRELLTQPQPYPNHNGGALVTGSDGALYLGLGDGGSQGDPDGNGQDLGTWLGKVLRIVPTPEAQTPYRVPSDNPFVGVEGARPEIWAYGLRNPWRFSFDRTTDDLWLGDVGGSEREEIDWRPGAQAAGTNFGWSAFEGTRRARERAAVDPVPPVYEYTHDAGGCSVVAGYVYRGTRIPDLRGRFLFGDFCSGAILALSRDGDRAQLVPGIELSAASVVSFGEDADGELYIVSLDGPVYRLDPA